MLQSYLEGGTSRWEGLGRKREGGRGKEGQNQVWVEMEEMYKGSGDGELRVATRMSQMPGKQEPPRTPWGLH